MTKILCKNCKWWEPWKLPKDKTLFDMTRVVKEIPTANKYSRRGDCRNEYSTKGATYSSTTCGFAEEKD